MYPIKGGLSGDCLIQTQDCSPHLPHPPPPIGGAPGPPPKFILPIRFRPPGGPGGLHKQATEKREKSE